VFLLVEDLPKVQGRGHFRLGWPSERTLGCLVSSTSASQRSTSGSRILQVAVAVACSEVGAPSRAARLRLMD
jgi:hypothetical protein